MSISPELRAFLNDSGVGRRLAHLLGRHARSTDDVIALRELVIDGDANGTGTVDFDEDERIATVRVGDRVLGMFDFDELGIGVARTEEP